MNKLTTRLFLVLAAFPLPGNAQNLLTNGGFESVAHSSGSITTLSVGSAGLPEWNIEGSGTCYLVSAPLSGFLASEGNQFLSLNSYNCTLSQSFATVPGESYDVSFSVGFYQGNANMAVIADVFSEGGQPLGSLSSNAMNSVGWRLPTRFRFTATSALSKLQFRGTNATPNVDLLLDAVSVEPVMQPVTIGIADVQICWVSKSNRVYQLQYRSSLTTNLWADLGASILGTGSNICSVQPLSEPQRFFRVVTLP